MVKPIPTLKKSVNNATAIPAAFAQQFMETSKFPEALPPGMTAAVVPEQAAPQADESAAAAPMAEAPADNLVSLRAPRTEPSKPANTLKHTKHGRAVMTRAGGAVVRKTTVYISPELDRRLALHAFDSGLDRSEVVSAALERFLRGKD